MIYDKFLYNLKSVCEYYLLAICHRLCYVFGQSIASEKYATIFNFKLHRKSKCFYFKIKLLRKLDLVIIVFLYLSNQICRYCALHMKHIHLILMLQRHITVDIICTSLLFIFVGSTTRCASQPASSMFSTRFWCSNINFYQ